MHRLPAQGVRSRLSAEHGVTLIETLVSAVVLIIVIGAVLTTIDASGRTATVNKNRSVAAALAEQDQERMRAMSPTALDGHSRTQTVDVDGVPYKVESRSEWMFDATGATQRCEDSIEQPDYMRISSTVSSSVVSTRVKPVTMRSLVSPRVGSFPEDTGTLTVKVTNHLGEPVVGMLVTISPAAKVPQPTNEFGCAVFSHIAAGPYTAILNTPGWINEQREQLYDASSNVQVEKTTNVAMTYAPAAHVKVNVKTGATPGSQPSSAHAVTLANAKSGDLVTSAPPTAAVDSITVGPLWPYPDGYTAFTGRCGLNDPADSAYQPQNAEYVATKPGFTNVMPGPIPTEVDAHQPPVNLEIRRNGAPLDAARVVYTPIMTPSGAPQICGAYSATARFVRATDASGFVAPDRGLPFGNYAVCIDKVIGSSRYKATIATLDNTSPYGVTPSAVTLSSTGTACST